MAHFRTLKIVLNYPQGSSQDSMEYHPISWPCITAATFQILLSKIIDWSAFILCCKLFWPHWNIFVEFPWSETTIPLMWKSKHRKYMEMWMWEIPLSVRQHSNVEQISGTRFWNYPSNRLWMYFHHMLQWFKKTKVFSNDSEQNIRWSINADIERWENVKCQVDDSAQSYT